MLDKIKNYEHYAAAALKSLQDVRTLGLLMFLVVALLISWSGIKVIETNYGLQKNIAELSQQNDVNKLKNRNLELQNQYYKTNEYLELEARKNFGLAAPGETVLVVPKAVALKHTVAEPLSVKEPQKVENKPKYQQNFDSWMDFLFHRQNTTV
jgi:cell division protein FtsB